MVVRVNWVSVACVRSYLSFPRWERGWVWSSTIKPQESSGHIECNIDGRGIDSMLSRDRMQSL